MIFIKGMAFFGVLNYNNIGYNAEYIFRSINENQREFTAK